MNSAAWESGLPEVDVILPSYDESPTAVQRTLGALRAQTHPPGRVIFVDDGSSDDSALVLASTLGATTLRMPQNSGIAAARNEGMRFAVAPFVAFVNVEVLLRSDWIERCAAYMHARERVGVVAARTVPEDRASLLTRWRMRYHEAPYPAHSGPIPWGSGHALLFRREAFLGIGGFDVYRRKAGEDVDACFRMQAAGWEVHFLAETSAISIQEDTPRTIARAEYNRSIYRAETGNGLWRGLGIATNRMIQRSLRHVIFLRWPLLLVEPEVFWFQLRSIWRHR